MKSYKLSAGNAVAEVIPDRGGLVTRCAIGGDEIFYLDPATVEDETKNVRGGVPILFPWAGRPRPEMRQHGFARQMPFFVTGLGDDEISMELTSSAVTHALFPHDFRLSVFVLVRTGAMFMRIKIQNTGSQPMPVHFGLHPYFRVPLESKPAAAVSSPATRAFDNTAGQVRSYSAPDFGAGETDLHLLDHAPRQTQLSAPGLATRLIEWDDFMPVLVLWTQPAKDFICVEPWTALARDFDQAPLLEPGAKAGGIFRVSVPAG